MIKKTQTSSLRGSMTGSFGDNLVCYSTPQQAKGRNSKAIHYEEKKYESCVVINTNIVQKESSLQSFDEPPQRKKQRNSKAVTFIDSTPVSLMLRLQFMKEPHLWQLKGLKCHIEYQLIEHQ